MAIRYVVIKNRIPALIAFVEAESRAAVKRSADNIVRRAKNNAPKVSGYLAGSIHAVSVEAGKTAEVQVDAEYAPYVEYGTYKMSARPYLQPAMSAEEEEFFSNVGKKLFARFR